MGCAFGDDFESAAHKLYLQLPLLVVFCIRIGGLSDNNCLRCSSQVVSAAAFRIFGKEVEELPLVATRSDCQGWVKYTCPLILSSFSF